MEQLIYLLKVSACTFLFFGFYLLILKNLTFFKSNRFYLLGALFLSFAIPALQIKVEKEIKTIETQVPIAPIDVKNIGAVGANEIEVLPMPISNTSFDWFSAIPYIYFGIVAALLLVSIWQLLRLIGFTKDYSEPFNGLKLISKESGFTNCSFFNYVFINKTNLSETDLQVLLRHEQVHANQYHSIDKILLMFVKAVLWFNPIIYLFDKTLEQTHEYEADEATSQSFGNNAYASLLLRLSVIKSDMPLIHNFVKSPLKERIKMLFNSKSSNMKRLVYFFVLPIGLGLVWLFSVQMVYIDPKVKTDLVFKAEQPLVKKDETQEKQKLTKKEELKEEMTSSSGNKDTIKLSGLIVPKIISSTKITGDMKSGVEYIEDAVIEIRGSRLKAKSVKWDRKNNILTAYKANNFNGDQGVISDEIVFDLKTGAYKTFDSSIDESRNTVGNYNLKQKDLLNEGIRYSALDSVRLSKDKSIISLYGKAKVYFKNMTIDADEITFNNITNSGNAKNLTLTNESGIKVKGSNAKFNLNGKVEIWQDSDYNQTVEP